MFCSPSTFCQFSSGSLINVCTSALTSSRYFPGSLLICVLAQCVNRIWGEAHLEQIHRTVIVCCCQLNPRGPSRHEPHPLPYSITKHSRPICFSRWWMAAYVWFHHNTQEEYLLVSYTFFFFFLLLTSYLVPTECWLRNNKSAPRHQRHLFNHKNVVTKNSLTAIMG